MESLDPGLPNNLGLNIKDFVTDDCIKMLN